MPMPEFFTSPYFVCEVDNWHLKPGAPDDIKKEFEEYMKNSDIVFAENGEEENDDQ